MKAGELTKLTEALNRATDMQVATISAILTLAESFDNLQKSLLEEKSVKVELKKKKLQQMARLELGASVFRSQENRKRRAQ